MPILVDVYTQAISKCSQATSLVSASNELCSYRATANGIIYTDDLNNYVIDYAFLRIFTTFESFLEEIFICYMLGQQGLNGNIFTRYVSPVNEEHARRIVTGISRFADFTNRDTILKLANCFFDNGGSFINLNTISKDFEDMKTIRNAITHISPDSKTKFDNMIRTKLGGLPSGITTAIFLNSFTSNTSRQTFFTHYKDTVQAAMYNIVNP